MTVHELIAELEKIQNKTIPVCIIKPTFSRGSSRTGMWESGSKAVNIKVAKFVDADEFAGLDEIDKIAHVELFEGEDYEDDN